MNARKACCLICFLFVMAIAFACVPGGSDPAPDAATRQTTQNSDWGSVRARCPVNFENPEPLPALQTVTSTTLLPYRQALAANNGLCILHADYSSIDDCQSAGVPLSHMCVHIENIWPPGITAFSDAWLVNVENQVRAAMPRFAGVTCVHFDQIDHYYHDPTGGLRADFERNVPRLVGDMSAMGLHTAANVGANQYSRSIAGTSDRYLWIAGIERTGDCGSVGDPFRQAVVDSTKAALDGFALIGPGGRMLQMHDPLPSLGIVQAYPNESAQALGVITRADIVLLGPAPSGSNCFPDWGTGSQPFATGLGRCSDPCTLPNTLLYADCEHADVLWNDTDHDIALFDFRVQSHSGRVFRHDGASPPPPPPPPPPMPTCTPHPEVCNGLDDDCDGVPDDHIPDQTCGLGACQRTVPGCVHGTVPLCVPGTPSMEICGNPIDEDCDGVAEACAPPPPSASGYRYEFHIVAGCSWPSTSVNSFHLRDDWWAPQTCSNSGSFDMPLTADGWHRCDVPSPLTPFVGSFYDPMNPTGGDHGNFGTVGVESGACVPTGCVEWRVTNLATGAIAYFGPSSGLPCVLVGGQGRHALP